MEKVPCGKLHLESTFHGEIPGEIPGERHVQSLVPTRVLVKDLFLAIDEWPVPPPKDLLKWIKV